MKDKQERNRKTFVTYTNRKSPKQSGCSSALCDLKPFQVGRQYHQVRACQETSHAALKLMQTDDFP